MSTCIAPRPARATHPSLDGGWSLGEQAFAEISTRFRSVGARSVLEFGSGASTVRLALALPEARVVSVEHDASYCERTARLAREQGVADRIVLCHAPLGYWRYEGRLFFTYDVELPAGPYDVALIDGPPGYLMTGRQACLPRCWGLLPLGALVVLDDFREPREQRAAARWRAMYPDAFIETEVDVGHGLLVLEKIRHVEPAALTACERLRNLSDNLRSLVLRARRRLARGQAPPRRR